MRYFQSLIYVVDSSLDTLTQLFLRGPFLHEGDSLQDRPEQHAQREDVCLGRVGQPSPHLRSHVEVRAAGGGEVLPGQMASHHTFTHLAQTEVRHLEDGRRDTLKKKYRTFSVLMSF